MKNSHMLIIGAFLLLSGCVGRSPETALVREGIEPYYANVTKFADSQTGNEQQASASHFALKAGPWRKLHTMPFSDGNPAGFENFCANKNYIIPNGVAEAWCNMHLADTKEKRKNADLSILYKVDTIDNEIYSSGGWKWTIGVKQLFIDEVKLTERKDWPCWTCWD